LSIVS